MLASCLENNEIQSKNPQYGFSVNRGEGIEAAFRRHQLHLPLAFPLGRHTHQLPDGVKTTQPRWIYQIKKKHRGAEEMFAAE